MRSTNRHLHLHLLCMPTLNHSQQLLENTYPVAFAVCVNFPQYDHKIYTYFRDNVVQEFFKYVTPEQNEIDAILSTNHRMSLLTDKEWLAHNAATICSTCENNFTKNNNKVRDHCHVTGQYIAPVCNNCNLRLKNRTFGNVFLIFFCAQCTIVCALYHQNFHDPNAKVQLIPTNWQKFLAMQIDSIRFLDSFLFLSSSLDKLVSTMARDNTD